MKNVSGGGIGNPCPKCSELMERRRRTGIGKRDLKKPYVFLEWDICKDCGHIQHYEDEKFFINIK